MSKKIECPICLGEKQFMDANVGKGFSYKSCNFCDKDGKVPIELYNDYILSQDEENNYIDDE